MYQGKGRDKDKVYKSNTTVHITKLLISPLKSKPIVIFFFFTEDFFLQNLVYIEILDKLVKCLRLTNKLLKLGVSLSNKNDWPSKT